MLLRIALTGILPPWRSNSNYLEGDNPSDHRTITYQELHDEVCKFSNVLKANGARKGDRITIYMPMIPEATVAMLACARIGAVHSVVFGGFSPDALAGRILDCESTMVITADEGVRGGKSIPLKQFTDKALQNCPDCTKSIVVRRTGGAVDWVEGRDVWYHEAMATASAFCPAEEMNAEDPMFILTRPDRRESRKCYIRPAAIWCMPR